jgi:A/G-specific adenine glycosylase
VLRDAEGPVHRSRLDAVWADEVQRARCLASLIDDGLVSAASEHTFTLPGA